MELFSNFDSKDGRSCNVSMANKRKYQELKQYYKEGYNSKNISVKTTCKNNYNNGRWNPLYEDANVRY